MTTLIGGNYHRPMFKFKQVVKESVKTLQKPSKMKKPLIRIS
jgi:hypothetical protein